MNTWTATALRFRGKDADTSGALTLAQVDDVIGWAGAVDGALRARLLIGQLASCGEYDASLSERCSGAILATDIADYAETMQQVCGSEPRLTGGVIERPDWRPLTRFEQRGLDAGRAPTDLIYTRV